MIAFSKKIAAFFLRTVQNSFEISTLKERYKQFRVSLLIAITIIALIPSTLLSILGYLRYLELAHRQGANYTRWHLKYVSHNLEIHIDSLKKIVTTTAGQISTIHLENKGDLQFLFETIQKKEKSLIEIELINLEGQPLSSSFSALQAPVNYAETPWFQQVLSDGVVVSSMQFPAGTAPNFIIAIRHTLEKDKKEFILKAVFNGIALEELAREINANAMEDVFLINREGILVSTSLYFGKRQTKIPFTVPADVTNIITTNKRFGMGKIFYATTPILGTPWIITLIKDGPVQKSEWLTFQLSLLFIFVVCAIGSFLIIHQLVNLLTSRIRESDTKRMALLNEVGHTNRLATIGKLAAGVAHEINNPLAVIDQKAGLIEDLLEISNKFEHKDKLISSLQGIHTSVERCKVITHRLLGFARKMDTINEPLSINFILQEVVGFLEKEALFSHIIFDIQLQKDLPEIWSDKGQLQQIFLNIISNSIDAIGKNGKITITTSLTNNDKILVEVKDDGPGIKPEVMEHIFDPFFTTKKTGEGTGLGLSITYGLVKKLGGDVKVYSTVGKGAAFSIYLPTKSLHKRGKSNG